MLDGNHEVVIVVFDDWGVEMVDLPWNHRDHDLHLENLLARTCVLELLRLAARRRRLHCSNPRPPRSVTCSEMGAGEVQKALEVLIVGPKGLPLVPVPVFGGRSWTRWDCV